MKKNKKSNNYISKEILFLTVLLCLIISLSTYWIYAYNHKFGKNYLSDRFISYKINDYVTLNGNIIYLSNIDEDISNEFVIKQSSILNNNVIDTDIVKGMYNGILSIKITYTLSDEVKVLTTNIDVVNNKVLTNEEILDKVGSSYKDIATDIYNNYIKLTTDTVVIDNITNEKLTTYEFNSNEEKYIIRIREKLPDIINLYIDNDKVYYTVNLYEIEKVCYLKDNNTVMINQMVGKI